MLTVIILTKNEQERLETCLKSVAFADEIIIVDNDSTDKTVEIAKKYTKHIVKSSDSNFASRRNLGLEYASGDWVLYVDADERLLLPLKNELQTIMSESSNEGAWQISRRNIILGEEKRYAAFWPDCQTRFFRRKDLQKWEGDVHEHPLYSGTLHTTKSSLLHLTHRDIDSMVIKSLSWANIDARLRQAAGHPPMTGMRFLRIILTEMWQQGIIRRGFFNGTVGIIDSLLQVFSMYISYVKLWQLQREKTLDETYNSIDSNLVSNNFEY